MPDQKTVFISYRRPVSTVIASAVYQHLVMHRYDAFMDTETVDTDAFDAMLLRQMDTRAHFVVILTPGNMTLYAHAEDWQRRKIQHAIASGRNIVTLLVNGFDFQAADPYFHGELARLSHYPAITVPSDSFEAAMERLRQTLDGAAEVAVTPMSAHEDSMLRKTHRMAQLKRITPQQLQAEGCFQRAFTRPEHDHAARIADFTEALQHDPKYTTAYLYRSASRRIVGDLDGAIEDATEVIRRQPSEPSAHNARGIAYYLRGNIPEAIADYSEALILQPYDAATLINRGDARRASSYFEGALLDYTGAIERSPVSQEEYRQFCEKFHLQPVRQVSEALARFKRLRFIAYTSRGEIRRIQKNMSGAIEDFTAALALFPDDVAALLSRAESQMQMDNMDAAIDDLTAAIEHDPRNATLYHQRGFAYHEKGNAEAAITDYTQALNIDPRAVLTYCNRAEVLLEHDDYAAALADWNAAHELRPGFPLILAGLALTHHGTGNVELAADVWKLLIGADERFKEAESAARLLNWKAPLIEKTRRLLEDLT